VRDDVPMNSDEVRYAWNMNSALAYQVVGSGPVDLVYLQGYLSNVELNWDHPALARFLGELARSTRLVVTDRRGVGCSERFTPADAPPIETLMDDVLAVLEAVGSERPVVFATGDCGFIACLFAATYPERVAGLILFGSSPTWMRSDEVPWGTTAAELEESTRLVVSKLGDGTWTRNAAPSLVRSDDERAMRWAARYERLTIAPGSTYSETRRFAQTDVRGVLPSIQVPTLVLHRTDDAKDNVQGGRYLAEHIRTARFIELPGPDHFAWAGDADAVLREVTRFLDTLREDEAALDRVLATVLFTDVVGSTQKLAELGDRGWRDLVERHNATVRAQLARYRGREVSTAGDGFFALFDGPARAVRCAEAIVEAVKPLGLRIRAGVHTGEVETISEDVVGIAVNIGARLGALAGASEVLVSQTVRDLVAGSGLTFEDRGVHELKGVPGEWRAYAVARDAA
jgi:class 3 adenylate cyclase